MVWQEIMIRFYLLGMVWIGFFHIWACVLLEGMEHSRLGCVEPAVRAVFKNRDVHTVCVECSVNKKYSRYSYYS
jgi:hypothetical protein